MMTNDQKDLIRNHMYLVAMKTRQIRKRLPLYTHWDDIFSDAQLGICIAALTWRPERGSNFSTWAGISIYRYIIDGWRSRMWGFYCQGTSKMIQHDFDNYFGDDKRGTVGHEIETKEELESLMHCLTTKQKRWLIAYYIDDRSIDQISKEENVCFTAPCGVVKAAKKNMKKERERRERIKNRTGLYV